MQNVGKQFAGRSGEHLTVRKVLHRVLMVFGPGRRETASSPPAIAAAAGASVYQTGEAICRFRSACRNNTEASECSV